MSDAGSGILNRGEGVLKEQELVTYNSRTEKREVKLIFESDEGILLRRKGREEIPRLTLSVFE